MTPMEILNQIVEAESSARQVYDEAEALKQGFDDYVNQHIEALRTQYFEQAEAAIQAAREKETARADREIGRLEKDLSRDLEAVSRAFEKRREGVVERIFRLAVNADA